MAREIRAIFVRGLSVRATPWSSLSSCTGVRRGLTDHVWELEGIVACFAAAYRFGSRGLRLNDNKCIGFAVITVATGLLLLWSHSGSGDWPARCSSPLEEAVLKRLRLTLRRVVNLQQAPVRRALIRVVSSL